MISFTMDASDLVAKVSKVDQYTKGYMEGLEEGKAVLMQKIGAEVSELAGRWMDGMAGGNPSSLHHVYEWGSVGGARLFDINFTATSSTVTFTTDFRQSGSIAPTADRPFYNKAEVMEAGQSVSITPSGGVLRFFGDSGVVYTPHTVVVDSPGGPGVAGGFKRFIDQFFSSYVEALIMGGLLSQLASLNNFNIGGGGYGAGYSAGFAKATSVSVGGLSI